MSFHIVCFKENLNGFWCQCPKCIIIATNSKKRLQIDFFN
nr:MAG TPA: Smyd3 methyltransferase inhibitor, methyltransferase, methyltransferase inhibitor [Caudoviricetes sp.]